MAGTGSRPLARLLGGGIIEDVVGEVRSGALHLVVVFRAIPGGRSSISAFPLPASV